MGNQKKFNYNLKTKNTAVVPKDIKNITLRKYLLGDNDLLGGTIIAIRKNLHKSSFDEALNIYKETFQPLNSLIPQAYSVLLYFDHRYAKITRYLYNPNLTFWGKKPTILDKTVPNDIKYSFENATTPEQIDRILNRYCIVILLLIR